MAALEADEPGEGEDLTPYCYCSRPSFGEMIGCEGESCAIEWVSDGVGDRGWGWEGRWRACEEGRANLGSFLSQFHLGCVGLQTIPKGSWWCDECNVKRNAKTSKSRR